MIDQTNLTWVDFMAYPICWFLLGQEPSMTGLSKKLHYYRLSNNGEMKRTARTCSSSLVKAGTTPSLPILTKNGRSLSSMGCKRGVSFDDIKSIVTYVLELANGGLGPGTFSFEMAFCQAGRGVKVILVRAVASTNDGSATSDT